MSAAPPDLHPLARGLGFWEAAAINVTQIVGAPDAPYLSSLIKSGTLLTSSHGVTHPSEPNYLAMFSGSTHNLTSDACPVSYSAWCGL